MAADTPPEQVDAAASPLTLEQALRTIDRSAQPGPDDLELAMPPDPLRTGKPPDLSKVEWPADDRHAPDYAYLANENAATAFTLTADILESLFRHSRYAPYRNNNLIAFALRGATLAQGHEVENADAVAMKTARPDHRHFRCVVGFYRTDTRKLLAYTGSTVPCRLGVWGYANGGKESNLLPTGMHTYYVWRHKNIFPALRMGKSETDPETESPRTVLRTTGDYAYRTDDTFDLSKPMDNVHCSYHLSEHAKLGAYFSSWGCLTVRGEETPSNQWKKFQAVLTALGQKKRVDLMLATGRDAAFLPANMANRALVDDKMAALRHGSRGSEVKRLQTALHETPTGYFGPETLRKLTLKQRQLNETSGHGPLADGVYTKDWDKRTGWKVF